MKIYRKLFYVIPILSLLLGVIYYKLLLNNYAQTFKKDFKAQNIRELNSGDSIFIIQRLNNITRTLNAKCITAYKNKILFFDFKQNNDCKANPWEELIFITGDVDLIGVYITMSLPKVIQKLSVISIITFLLIIIMTIVLEKHIKVKEEKAKIQLINKSLTRLIEGEAPGTRMLKELPSLSNEWNELKSKLTQVKDELVQKSKHSAIGEFSREIAHDLKGPSSAIIAAIENINSHAVGTPSTRRDLHEVVNLAKRVNRYVKDMLDYSKTEKISIFEISNFRFKNALYEIINSIVIGYEDLEINIDYRLKVTSIKLDVEKFERIVSNIILNSCKASKYKGTINVEVKDSKPYQFVLTITDFGAGIESDIKSQVFTPYFTTDKKSSGMGLVIVKKFVDLHGGSINIESLPNKWTRVEVQL